MGFSSHVWPVWARDLGPTNATIANPNGPPAPHTFWLQDLLIAMEVILLAIALTVCGLRAYIRICLKNLGWDDYCIFFACLLCVLQTPIRIIYIKVNYMGIHIWETPPHDAIYPVYINFLNGLIYFPILSFAKISILAFMLRFTSARCTIRRCIWALIWFVAASTVAVFLITMLACKPIQYNWDIRTPGGTCIDKRWFFLWTTCLALLTDILTLALPFVIFLGLRIPKPTKRAVLCVFALGILDTLVGCLRFGFLIRSTYFTKPYDYNFNGIYVVTTIETNLAVVTACGPALWPLARRWFPGLFKGIPLIHGYQRRLTDLESTTLEKMSTGDSSSGISSNRRISSDSVKKQKPSEPHHTGLFGCCGARDKKKGVARGRSYDVGGRSSLHHFVAFRSIGGHSIINHGLKGGGGVQNETIPEHQEWAPNGHRGSVATLEDMVNYHDILRGMEGESLRDQSHGEAGITDHEDDSLGLTRPSAAAKR